MIVRDVDRLEDRVDRYVERQLRAIDLVERFAVAVEAMLREHHKAVLAQQLLLGCDHAESLADQRHHAERTPLVPRLVGATAALPRGALGRQLDGMEGV